MKRFIYYFLLATISVASFVKCTKEDSENAISDESKSGIIKFKANPVNVESKATLTPNAEDTEFTAAWENGETMVLNAVSAVASFNHDATATWDNTEKEFSADFGEVVLPTEPSSWDYKAWYPAKSGIPFGSNRVQNGNNYNSVYDIMYGELNVPNGMIGKDGNDNAIVVGLNRLTGIAYFHITGGPDEAVLGATLTTNEDLAAETVTIASGGASLTPTKGKNTISLSFSSAPNAQDFKLWFNVLPGDYTGLTLTIYTATKKATLSASAISFTAGKLSKVKKNITTWTSQLYYTKVTNTSELSDDNYLIVYEPDNVAFNGGLTTLDAGNNVVSVPIIGSFAVNTSAAESAVFAIKSLGSSYFSIKSSSGLFIGKEESTNGIDTDDEAINNTISFNEGSAIISGVGGYQLRFNSTSGASNYRFRYYASDKQQNIALYKINDSRTPQTLSFPLASYEAAYPDPGTFDAPLLSGANTTVTYSSSVTSVASVNSTTGAITLNGIGTTIITASAEANDTYRSGTASYTLTVSNSSITSIAVLKQNMTTTEKSFNISLTNAVITGKNGKNAYIEDASAGIYIYNCASALEVGDKYSGDITVSAKIYNNQPEITAFDATSATKSTGATLPLTTKTVAQLIDNIDDLDGKRVQILGVQLQGNLTGSGNTTVSRAGSSIKVYSRDGDVSLNKFDVVNIIGFPMNYNGNTPEIILLDDADAQTVSLTWNLKSISVTTPPTKTSYIAGEFFNPSGMVVTATYDDSTEEYTKLEDVTASCTFNPSTNTPLTTDNTSISITFSGKSTSQAINVSSGGYSWSRVTAVSQLTAGGTFIIGYEGTANSGVIVPMRAAGTMTTSATGYLYSGTSTGTTSSNNTLTMSSTMTSSSTSSYEVTIAASGEVDGAIVIKIGNKYIGNENAKNCVKLYTSEANYTAFTPTFGDNDVVTLEISANTGNTDNYKYLKFNNSSGSYRFAVYKTTPDKIVIYKKGASAN